jgi:hypothetical protein
LTDLDDARELFAAGDDKKALRALRRVEAACAVEPSKTDAQGLLEVASAIRDRTQGRLSSDAARLVGYASEHLRRANIQADRPTRPRGVPAKREPPERIRKLLTRVGVRTEPTSASRTLIDQPVLVLSGQWRQSLGIYDQRGREIGDAIRINDDAYSKVGYWRHYELRDSQPRGVLRDVTPGRFWSGAKFKFSVLDAHEVEIATISRSGSASLDITADGQLIAAVRRVRGEEARQETARTRQKEIGRLTRILDWLRSGMVWSVEDERGYTLARITYISRSSRVAYVVTIEPETAERLRVIALTACLVIDDKITDRGSGGG